MDGTPFKQAPLPRSFPRSHYLLSVTLANLFRRHPVDHVLFVTLTFPDDVRSTTEARRRLNSLLNKVRPRRQGYLYTLEPQRSGRIHYHMLVPVSLNTHDGTDLDAWANRQFYTDEQRRQSMNPALRAESDWWEQKAEAYGFGRIEVAPIFSNGEAVSKYLLKQEWRRQHWPFEETKHVRFWSCSRELRSGSVTFSWNTPGGRLRREKLRAWANWYDCHSIDELRVKVGRNWGFWFLQELLAAEGRRDHVINSTVPDRYRDFRLLQFLAAVFPDCEKLKAKLAGFVCYSNEPS